MLKLQQSDQSFLFFDILLLSLFFVIAAKDSIFQRTLSTQCLVQSLCVLVLHQRTTVLFVRKFSKSLLFFLAVVLSFQLCFIFCFIPCFFRISCYFLHAKCLFRYHTMQCAASMPVLYLKMNTLHYTIILFKGDTYYKSIHISL